MNANDEEAKASEATSTRDESPSPPAAKGVKNLTEKRVVRCTRRMLAKQRNYGLPGTDGTFWCCFREHLLEEGILLSVFEAHEFHPYSRKQRLIVLLSTITWMFFLSALIGVRNSYWFLQALLVALLSIPYEWLLRAVVEARLCIRHNFLETDVRRLGNAMLILSGLLIIAWIVLGTLIAVNVTEKRPFFIPLWIVAQAFSLLLLDPLQQLTLTWWYYEKDKALFEAKWGALFPEGVPPVTITQVAELVPEHSPTFAAHLRIPGTYPHSKVGCLRRLLMGQFAAEGSNCNEELKRRQSPTLVDDCQEGAGRIKIKIERGKTVPAPDTTTLEDENVRDSALETKQQLPLKNLKLWSIIESRINAERMSREKEQWGLEPVQVPVDRKASRPRLSDCSTLHSSSRHCQQSSVGLRSGNNSTSVATTLSQISRSPCNSGNNCNIEPTSLLHSHKAFKTLDSQTTIEGAASGTNLSSFSNGRRRRSRSLSRKRTLRTRSLIQTTRSLGHSSEAAASDPPLFSPPRLLDRKALISSGAPAASETMSLSERNARRTRAQSHSRRHSRKNTLRTRSLIQITRSIGQSSHTAASDPPLFSPPPLDRKSLLQSRSGAVEDAKEPRQQRNQQPPVLPPRTETERSAGRHRCTGTFSSLSELQSRPRVVIHNHTTTSTASPSQFSGL